MAKVDNGPASGNAEIVFNLPGGPVVTGLEVHVGGQTPTNPDYSVNGQCNGAPNGTGTLALAPALAGFVDPGQAGSGVTGNPVVPKNTTQVFGTTGATIVFNNPA